MNIEWIMSYEDGQLDDQEVIEGFQEMINTGEVWKLQGHYGRMAAALIEKGLCTSPKRTKSEQ